MTLHNSDNMEAKCKLFVKVVSASDILAVTDDDDAEVEEALAGYIR